MIAWLQRNRTSVRLAFILRLFAMATGALLSLLWTRLLLRAMGDAAYGIFLTFQSVTRLGGLGDFGISGAVGLKAGQMLGRSEDENLRKLLASARSVFLLIAAILFFVLAALSPWLPQWLHFRNDIAGIGSLPLLFVWGGVSVTVFVLSGYFNNLNYAHGTVTWPIWPGVFIGQTLAPLLHWQLAKMHEPLWVQNLPYVGSTLFMSWLAWRMLKWSHPWLGDLRPLRLDPVLVKMLMATSGWAYLSSLGSAVYFNTDRLVLNAGFGPDVVPKYNANYTAVGYAVILICSASFVSLPKLTQWISSVHEADRRRALAEAQRLNIFQILLGCGAALGYLALNDFFVKHWLGAKYQGPLAWQIAFACNLVVTVGGDAGIVIASRCGESGMKKLGLAVGGTGLLNLALSLVSMKFGSITGIAAATVIAQSVLSISLGYVACRFLKLSLIRWTVKSWLLPLAIVFAAVGLKVIFSGQDLPHIGVLLACYAGLFVVAALLTGMDGKMLRSEIATLRAMLKI
jgi:O-antigen/teichoic acid export membrane protein